MSAKNAIMHVVLLIYIKEIHENLYVLDSGYRIYRNVSMI